MSYRNTICGLLVVLVLCVSCGKKSVGAPGGGLDHSVTTTLEVRVKGLKTYDGRMRLALFSSADGFPGEAEKAFRVMDTKIEADPVIFVIEDIPSGSYALSIFHDEDINNEMETDFRGRPKEGYAFSNNARGNFGPPGFDDAAFEVRGRPITVEVDLVY